MLSTGRFICSGWLVFGCAWVLSIGTPWAVADQVVLSAEQDTTLIESLAGELSNGSGEHLFAGRTSQGAGFDRRRGLIRFDVSGVVPSGSIINAVSLTLNMSRSQSGDRLITLHRVLSDWSTGASDAPAGEGAGAPATLGDATWLHTHFDTSLWTNLGGDYAAAPSAGAEVGGEGLFIWTSAALLADLESWLQDPSINFGWVLIGDESAPQTTKRFDSSEHSNPANRPRLAIDYTPPGTGACCLADGNCQSLSQQSCDAAAGDYQGPGIPCDPNPCAPPTGGCCLSGGLCEIRTLAACVEQRGNYLGDDSACQPNTCPPDLEPFVDPLPVLPLAQPVSGAAGGTAHYELVISEFQQELHRDLPPTTVWGFDGSYPGPTLEARSGLPVTVEWINDIRDAQGNLRSEHYLPVDTCPHGAEDAAKTVVHLHGGHVPWFSDGYPEFTFLPGQSDLYYYPNNQVPATLWYHDHALGITRLNVYMGLAGFYLIRDDFEEALGLPAGEFEVPIVIQDRSFNADGSLQYPASLQDQFFGNTILVNGKVWPFLNVKQGKYRFRLLNGSNSRTYTLSLSNGMPFVQIGSDGGLLPLPVELTELTLTPAERADVVVDFAGLFPGTEVTLTNSAPAPFPGVAGVGVVPNVMSFVVGLEAGHVTDLPTSLRPIDPLQETEAAVQREFVLRKLDDSCSGSQWLINDLGWDDLTEFPELGTVEVWSFINRSGMVHPMHMHLVQFQILDRQPFQVVGEDIVPVGEPVPPPPQEAGWKDTVAVYPFEIARVIARFEGYTGKYAYHCHIAEHEDHEMMRQFVVVVPCTEDLDDSGAVDPPDLALLLGAWGPNPEHPADLNGDGSVGSADLAQMLGSWGLCPGFCKNDDDCDDLDLCNGPETCLGGFCASSAPLDCDDNDLCTIDSCDPAAGCEHAPVLCDDGDVCTLDSCDAVAGCSNVPIACADYVVDTTLDEIDGSCSDGDCSLRDALLLVADGESVGFDPAVFPPAAPATIDVDGVGLPVLDNYGVTIDGSNAGVIIEDSDSDLAHGTHGLVLSGDANLIKGLQIKNFDANANAHGLLINGSFNIIGGSFDPTAPNGLGEGCLVSSNGDGIVIDGEADFNVIRGCLVGTDLSGTAPEGNDRFGISIKTGASSNVIGGNLAEHGNVISGNASAGIKISNLGADDNVITGNHIGASISGGPLGNGAQGIKINDAALSTTVGGQAKGQGNLIAFNGGQGIQLDISDSDFHTWQRNLIFDNAGLAIAIITSGANEGILPPMIDSVARNQVDGSEAAANAEVDVFSNTDGDSDCVVYLGTATADAGGLWSLAGLNLTSGEFVVAVQTDLSGNSSEVSSAVPVP